MYYLFASYGNDSIALIQSLHENNITDVTVVYSNTGWAVDWWEDRVIQGETLAQSYGFGTVRIGSEGMLALVKRKSGWPQGGAKAFCTGELKVKPALAWMATQDPEKDATCVIGVRRAESQNRKDFPEWTENSEKHGGRELWAPLVRLSDDQRNELIVRAGFEVLPHRSAECFPCVHANLEDIRRLTEDRIALIDVTERDLGYTSKGNLRTFFRPKRHKGAVGIRAVIEWASRLRPRDIRKSQCNSGWCE